MVKNIAQHANGAQIKINSDKESKKNIKEVSVAINGTLEGKYRAAHLIIEQVEIFKNGGPVSYYCLLTKLHTQIIQSGKVLNQNLAVQIQNSGLFKDKREDKREIFTRKRIESEEKELRRRKAFSSEHSASREGSEDRQWGRRKRRLDSRSSNNNKYAKD